MRNIQNPDDAKIDRFESYLNALVRHAGSLKLPLEIFGQTMPPEILKGRESFLRPADSVR